MSSKTFKSTFGYKPNNKHPTRGGGHGVCFLDSYASGPLEDFALGHVVGRDLVPEVKKQKGICRPVNEGP